MKKHIKKIKSLLRKKRHHIGYTTSAVVFLSMGALLAQSDTAPFREPSSEPMVEEAEMFPEDIVDPREIENALREIGRLKGEARGLLKRTTKLQNAELKQRLTEIISQLDSFTANIKNPPADYTDREALMEFYDARMWEEVSKIRAYIELPQILKDIPLITRRVEKLIKLKSYQTFGLDMQGIANYLNEVKAAHTEANSLYKAGDVEGAMEQLEFLREDGHPGELEGAIRRLKEINDLIKRVRDKEIQKELKEMLAPIVEAINDGDFRTAHEILNEVHPLVMEVARKSYKAGTKSRTDIMKRLSEFEGKANAKLEEREQEEIRAEKMRLEEEMRMKEEARMKEEQKMMQEITQPVEIKPEQPVPPPADNTIQPPSSDATTDSSGSSISPQ